MMKNDTFESLVPGPKCSGPKYFRAKVYKRAEVFYGPKYFWAEVSVEPKLSLGQTGCEPSRQQVLKCAKGVKRGSSIVWHKTDWTKVFVQLYWYRQNIAKKLFQPPLNILNLFIITEQTVLVQSLYVVQRILLSSLYTLAPTLYLRAYCHHMYTVSYSDYTTKRRS